MKQPRTAEIRAVLVQHEDGMTARELHKLLPQITRSSTIMRNLHKMPDAYIDRWNKRKGARGQYEAVWCAVTTPPDCPHPTDRFQPVTQWRKNHA